ncbi:MAG: zinc ribbon domain-containing protein [Bradyrhizobiaceae bacterium]|nr:MAG: zinc ribbon domain-containing protein [Bradyrhizobiaceae bacterium]
MEGLRGRTKQFQIMPAYDYQCSDCGPFTVTRPMTQSDRTCRCTTCGKPSDRAWLRAPAVQHRSTSAMAVNTPSAAASASKTQPSPAAHISGCPCCRAFKGLRNMKASARRG